MFVSLLINWLMGMIITVILRMGAGNARGRRMRFRNRNGLLVFLSTFRVQHGKSHIRLDFSRPLSLIYKFQRYLLFPYKIDVFNSVFLCLHFSQSDNKEASLPRDTEEASFFGAGGGTRTHTPSLATDFESASSTIPTHRHALVLYNNSTEKCKC